MYYCFCLIVDLFIIYSFIGYLIEVTSCSFTEKKLNFSRGYFVGPYLPIFGVGSMIFANFFQKYKGDFFALFIIGLFSACILEYITSYLLEKIFKLRWWDYSSRKFNLNGRISLETGIGFGILGVLIVRYIHPFLLRFLLELSDTTIFISGTILFIIFFVDFVFSTYTISRLKIDISKYKSKDSTSYVRGEVFDSLKKSSIFYSRLFKSFPNFSKNVGIDKIRDFFDQKKD